MPDEREAQLQQAIDVLQEEVHEQDERIAELTESNEALLEQVQVLDDELDVARANIELLNRELAAAAVRAQTYQEALKLIRATETWRDADGNMPGPHDGPLIMAVDEWRAREVP
jgi:chromosome segregation ATPase